MLARIGENELRSLLEGYGHHPIFVTGDEPLVVHQLLAAALEQTLDEISNIQKAARSGESSGRPVWPMIVLRTPKGWTGPKFVDGLPVEGTFREDQVPVGEVRTNPEHLAVLEKWLRSYRPEELFDESGSLRSELAALAPSGNAAWVPIRMRMGDFSSRSWLCRTLPHTPFPSTGPERLGRSPQASSEDFLRDVIRANPITFRLVGPDETLSNRLGAVFEARSVSGRPKSRV